MVCIGDGRKTRHVETMRRLPTVNAASPTTSSRCFLLLLVLTLAVVALFASWWRRSSAAIGTTTSTSIRKDDGDRPDWLTPDCVETVDRLKKCEFRHSR